MIVNKELLDALTARACESPRLRMNYDLRMGRALAGRILRRTQLAVA